MHLGSGGKILCPRSHYFVCAVRRMMLEVNVEKIIQHIFVNRADLRSNRYIGIDAKRFQVLRCVNIFFWF